MTDITRKDEIIKHLEYLKIAAEIEAKPESINAEIIGAAIEALKQETVSKESYDHEYFLRKEFEIKIARLEQQESILEKIKKEIKSIRQVDTDGKSGTWYREPIDIINDTLQIIDKYRAESEDKK